MAATFKDFMDSKPISPFQWLTAGMLTWVMVLEGIDFQVAAYSAPALMMKWHLTRPHVAPLLAAAMIGMAVGTLIGSWTGDRYGRKPTLVVSVAIFGVLTIVCATAETPATFFLCRILGGFGLGAALPVVTAMMSEWMPRRASDKAVSIMTVGVPGGVMLGAVAGAWILPHLGWHSFFVIVGIVCVVSAVALLWLLRESPGFMVVKGRQQDAQSLVARVWPMPLRTGDNQILAEVRREGGASLFAKSNTRVNVGLWMTFLCSSLATYTISAWLTIILVRLHLPLATALRGPITYSSSAICGALAIGWLIDRLGSRKIMLALGSAALVSTAGMSVAFLSGIAGPALFTAVFLGLAVTGFCVGGLLPASLVLAARLYGTEIRSRGIGMMSAIGRVGAILSSFIGGAVLAIANESGFFALIAVLAGVIIAGVLTIDRHLGGILAETTGPGVAPDPLSLRVEGRPRGAA